MIDFHSPPCIGVLGVCVVLVKEICIGVVLLVCTEMGVWKIIVGPVGAGEGGGGLKIVMYYSGVLTYKCIIIYKNL